MVDLHADFDNLCERYLLGELTESECQEVEKAYFADDSLFERFVAVKEDLLDAYARGNLTGNKLKGFEQHYLATKARRQRVEEAHRLIKVVSAAALDTDTAQIESSKLSTTQDPKWWQLFARSHPVAWRTGLVAAMLMLIAVGWIVVRQIQTRRFNEERASNTSQPSERSGANVNREQRPAPNSGVNTGGERAASSPSPSARVTPEVAGRPPSSTSAQIASLTLLPLSSRDTGSANSLVLTPETRRIRLNLGFGDARYDSFEISVRTVDGQPVISRGGLKKASSNETGNTVSITFESSLLNRQDYIATLRGLVKNGKPETVGEYYFRVQHTPPQSRATPQEQ